MLINPKTAKIEDLLTVMYDGKHTYYESRFICNTDTGIVRVSRMLLAANKKGLLKKHEFNDHRYPFYSLTERGNQVVLNIKKKSGQRNKNIRTRVFAYLKENDGSTSKEISRGIKKSFNDVITSLRELYELNMVTMVKDGKSIIWYIE